MAATAKSISYRPSSFSLPLDSLKPNFTVRFPASNLFTFTGFGCHLELSKMNTKLVNTAAFRNGGSRKIVQIFSKDAFVEGSTTFSSQLMAEDFEATLNRLSKWVVTAIFIIVLVWKYDAESLWNAMGSAVNFIICVTLKRLFKQERPLSTLKSDPGMPSSHAQSIFYILTVSDLSIIERLGTNEFTLTITALALACGSYLSWLRVSQQFHTKSQVIVGGVVGSIFSILWFWSWHSFVFEAFLSFWWVRAVVVFGAATFFFGFLICMIRNNIFKIEPKSNITLKN